MQWFVQILINSLIEKLLRPLFEKGIRIWHSSIRMKKKKEENAKAGENYENNPTIDNANKLP